MVPVYICDDEPAVRENIRRLVEKQIMVLDCDMGPVYTAESAAALLAMLDGDRAPAIYMLDVDLQEGEDGFSLAAEIRKRDPRGYILFITGHGELAFQTFRYRLEAMDYIVKGDDGVLEARLQSCLSSIRQRLLDEKAGARQYYTLKIFDSIRHIPLDSILYFEAHGKQHRVSLHTDNEILEFFGSLQPIEEELAQAFFRSHRAFLVNRSRVACICLKEHLVELDNGETCLLSRSAQKGLAE